MIDSENMLLSTNELTVIKPHVPNRSDGHDALALKGSIKLAFEGLDMTQPDVNDRIREMMQIEVAQAEPEKEYQQLEALVDFAIIRMQLINKDPESYWHILYQPERPEIEPLATDDLIKQTPAAHCAIGTLRKTFWEAYHTYRNLLEAIANPGFIDMKILSQRHRPTRIICGFPGVGKSYMHGITPSCLDSDSSRFSWDPTDKTKRHPEWPANYICHINENLGFADYILVSSHDVVREALHKANIPFHLVYPTLEMKEEYLQRYKDRGSNEKFIQLLDQNYEAWIKELMDEEKPKHIQLQPGEYLADAINREFCRS